MHTQLYTLHVGATKRKNPKPKDENAFTDI